MDYNGNTSQCIDSFICFDVALIALCVCFCQVVHMSMSNSPESQMAYLFKGNED